MDVSTLSLSKSYTNDVAAGITAARVEGNSIILTLVDGSEAVCNLPVPADGKDGIDGKDGVSVLDLSIDTDGSLLCHMSDGRVIDAGYVPTVDPDLTNYYTKEEIDSKNTTFILKMDWHTGGSNEIMTDEANMAAASKFINDLYKHTSSGDKSYLIQIMNIRDSRESNAVIWGPDADFSTQTTSYTVDGVYFRSASYSYPNDWQVCMCRMIITGTWANNVFTATKANYRTELNGMFSPSRVLTKDNTSSFTPSGDYNPATKKYVDDSVANIDIPETDLSNYYTKEEVNSAIDAAITTVLEGEF